MSSIRMDGVDCQELAGEVYNWVFGLLDEDHGGELAGRVATAVEAAAVAALRKEFVADWIEPLEAALGRVGCRLMATAPMRPPGVEVVVRAETDEPDGECWSVWIWHLERETLRLVACYRGDDAYRQAHGAFDIVQGADVVRDKYTLAAGGLAVRLTDDRPEGGADVVRGQELEGHHDPDDCDCVICRAIRATPTEGGAA